MLTYAASVVNMLLASSSGEAGQGMAEYGLILALVAVVVIGALTVLGGGISSTMNTLSSSV